MKRYSWRISHVFNQWRVWSPHTPHTRLLTPWRPTPAWQFSPGEGRWARIASCPHRCWDNHTLLQLFIHREVFLSFQYPCPNDILRAIFVEPRECVQLLIPDCFNCVWQFFFFPSFSPSLPFLPLHLPLVGWCLSPNTLFVLASLQVSLFDHTLFIDWALYYLVLWTRQIPDAEQKIFGFTVFIFTAVLQWL